jgi:hypothetical protein
MSLQLAERSAFPHGCRCRESATGGECESCRKKKGANPSRLALNDKRVEDAPEIVQDALRAPGEPLDGGTRAFMESRFGHDFSNVRVHADGRGAASSAAVGALAYTVGHHIAFEAGRYEPSTSAGRRLLAHELAHVVQQSPPPQHLRQLRGAAGSDSVEREADFIASTVAEGAPAPAARFHLSPTIQRKVDRNFPGPPPASSPIPSCSRWSHETVMTEVARHYVRNQIDSEGADTVGRISCFSGIGACTIQFTSGVAVEAELLLLNPWAPPGVGGGRVWVQQTPSSLRLKGMGPRCSYDVDCSLGIVDVVPLECRAPRGGPFNPDDFPQREQTA